MAGWHFVSVSKSRSKEIKKLFAWNKKGFGSIPVMVTIGKTRWKTSIFPHSKLGVYILPLKKEVRKKEGIVDGKVIAFEIEIMN